MAAKRTCTKCGRTRIASSFPTARARVCTQCQRARASDARHATHVDATYGITADEYAAIIERQGGKCAACRQRRAYRLNVDHCHRLERLLGVRLSVRGGLCRRCNKVLRDVRDDADVLAGIVAYLADPPAWHVIDPKVSREVAA